jgi:hypothetical protein
VRASGTRASSSYSRTVVVAFELALLDDQRHLLDTGQRAQRERDVGADGDGAVRRLVVRGLRIEGEAQRHRIGDGGRWGRQRRAGGQVGQRSVGAPSGVAAGVSVMRSTPLKLAFRASPLRASGCGRAGLQRGVAGGAEVGVGAPVLVAHLEAVSPRARPDELVVVADVAQRGLVVGAPVVERAAQVERAAGERVGAAVGGEGLACASEKAQRERGGGETARGHWTRL